MTILVMCRPILGDSILAQPVFRSLRAWRPDARITAACQEGRRDFLSLHPEIDEVVEIPRHRHGGRLAFAARWLALVRALRRPRFDLVYDLMQTDRSSALCAAIRARRRAGFVKGRPRLRHRVYTDVAPWIDGEEGTPHAVDLYLAPLVAAGMPVATRSVALRLSDAELAAGRARLAAALPDDGRPRVVCHPGASTRYKEWPPEDFAAACDEIQARLGARVLLLGGPGEGEALRELRARMGTGPAVVEGVLPVRELAGVLAAADLFFGHDSGPMHVAAAVGTPVVALFGASSPAQWRPLGEGHTVLRPSIPCPCPFPAVCRPPNPYQMSCVRRVSRAEVVEALARRLGAA